MSTTAPKMQVPLLDLKQQHAALREELRAAVERVFESQHFILGEDVRQFEAEFASYTRTKHAVGCGSGSDALLLALLALDIGAGRSEEHTSELQSHSFISYAVFC